MSFFKKLFSKNEDSSNESSTKSGAEFKGIGTTEYFDKRYTLETINPKVLDGACKMIESYLIENKIERNTDFPVNHPETLDLVDQKGFGFVLYCKAFQLGEMDAAFFMAYCFSDYLITNYGFQLYIDSEPEFPLRNFTLKYNRDGVVLSLYPIEYTTKVLNGNEMYKELIEKLESHISKLPEQADLIKKYTNPE